VRTFKSLRLPLALAAISVLGIVGMLVFDGLGDVVAFVLAAAPLIVGLDAWRKQRPS